MSALTLEELEAAHPLPEGWSKPSVVEDTIVAADLELRRSGVASTGPDGEEMVGSAAGTDASPLDRAYFELVERVSIVSAIARRREEFDLCAVDGRVVGTAPGEHVFAASDDPARWRPARSSGVALHVDWPSAARRALWELCERDRLLRAWYGEVAPRRDEDAEASPLSRARGYEWLRFQVPEAPASPFSRGVRVSGVFGLPVAPGSPMVAGFAARPSLSEARRAAVSEALQGLAFLWGEPIPAAAPVFAPTPLYHLDTYQRPERHEVLRRWLSEGHGRYFEPTRGEPGDATPRFVDLTPAWSRGLRVCKAMVASARPLVFGDDPAAAHLPAELRVHPLG